MSKDKQSTITIPLAEYKRLKIESQFIAALIILGLDNWEGYDLACELIDKETREESEGKENEG